MVGGSLRNVRVLVHSGMDVNSLNDDGETPLHWACKVGSTEIVKYLLTHGASINAMDENGDTPLHWAAEENHTEVAELLLAQMYRKLLECTKKAMHSFGMTQIK